MVSGDNREPVEPREKNHNIALKGTGKELRTNLLMKTVVQEPHFLLVIFYFSIKKM